MMYTQQPIQEPVFTRRAINRIRHPSERRIYWIAVFVNLLAVLLLFAWLASEVASVSQQLEAIAQEQGVRVEDLAPSDLSGLIEELWYAEENQSKVQLLLTIFILVFFTVLILQYAYAGVKARAVQVTPHQFGELHAMAVQYAHRLGLKKVPEIYLVQENGILNAFTSNIIRKKYIQINADLLEIAYRQYHDVSSIGFVLAHEMAHIKLRHVSIWIRYTTMLSQLLPIIGPVLSRVREYSCDRLAQAVSQNDGIGAMMALTMGKHLYKNANVSDYLESSKSARGFWIWVVNLNASHPILPKRLRALADPARPGRLF